MAQEQESAFITCPHMISDPVTKEGKVPKPHYCGLDSNGRGRRTRLPVPFWCFDGEDFEVVCPECGKDILVKSRCLAEIEEAV